MYALIWVALVQILLVLFPLYGDTLTFAHMAVGAVVLVMAYLIRSQVMESQCPNRIKVIVKTTFGLAILQAVLGVALEGAIQAGNSFGFLVGAIQLLHAVNGLAIITQASASATAYDMWEEKEFAPSAPASSAPAA